MAYNTNETQTRHVKRSWWSRRTSMERRGLIFLIIAVVLIIVLIVILAVLLPKKNKDDDMESSSNVTEETCHTSGCVHAASTVIKYIDQSLDPCEDFYEFACGKFLKNTVIPDDRLLVGAFNSMNDVLNQQLKTMVEEPIKPNEVKPFRLLKKLYNICMNTTAIEINAVTTLKEILKDLGGWPALEGKEWKQDQFDWKKSIFKFRKHGLSTDNFLSFNIQPDPKNSTRRVLVIDQARLEFNRDNWLKGLGDNIVAAYYEYMIDLATLFGIDAKFAEYEIKTMIDFRTALANITLPPEMRRNDTLLYNPMTIDELQKQHPNIPWLQLINNVLVSQTNVMTRIDIVIVTSPKYINDLEELLQKTSKRVQANHAIFQAIRSLETFLPEDFRSRQQKFDSIAYGNPTRTPRWEECISIASGTFSLAAGALYVRKFFDKDAQQSAKEMVTDIRNEFVKSVKNVDWMDDATRKTAIEKALAMKTYVGYADELLDNAKLEAQYENINVNTDNYLYFVNNVSVYTFDETVDELWEQVDKLDWTLQTPPITVNAFYNLNQNSIQIPAAILQRLFFNKDRLKSMNYGAIGLIIGHEITHGFDDTGKQYDKDGNLRNWWDEKTDQAFKNKTKCIIDQYNSVTVPEVGLNLHGIKTQGENIADNGGLKQAYLAYKSWVARNGPEQKLPSLNYTADQLFWISAANSWCTKIRKKSLENDILNDKHSPAHYRILIPFRNLEYFAKDFKCPKGSKMNPIEKCQVW